MFVRLIFKRLGLKDNIWLQAIFYGAVYGILVFLLLLAADLFLRKNNLVRNFVYSLVIFLAMAAVYLIKSEVFRIQSKKY